MADIKMLEDLVLKCAVFATSTAVFIVSSYYTAISVKSLIDTSNYYKNHKEDLYKRKFLDVFAENFKVNKCISEYRR